MFIFGLFLIPKVTGASYQEVLQEIESSHQLETFFPESFYDCVTADFCKQLFKDPEIVECCSEKRDDFLHKVINYVTTWTERVNDLLARMSHIVVLRSNKVESIFKRGLNRLGGRESSLDLADPCALALVSMKLTFDSYVQHSTQLAVSAISCKCYVNDAFKEKIAFSGFPFELLTEVSDEEFEARLMEAHRAGEGMCKAIILSLLQLRNFTLFLCGYLEGAVKTRRLLPGERFP